MVFLLGILTKIAPIFYIDIIKIIEYNVSGLKIKVKQRSYWMIEKLKYHLQKVFSCKQMRVSCLAVMSAVTVAVVTLLCSSIYTVNVFDGEKTYTVRTLNKNATSVISGLKLKSNSYDIKTTSTKGKTTSVEICYNFPVYITRGNDTVEIAFSGGTVSDALNVAGFKLDKFDFVEPKADTVINDTVYIDFTDITYVNGVSTESIPFSTETVYSSSVKKGVTTLQTGANGVKEIKYTEKLVNGVSVEKNVTATKVLSKPVNAKRIVGTKASSSSSNTGVKTSSDVKCISWLNPASPIELDANGNPVNYKSKMTVRATAYTYTGNNCATGVAPKPGYIAVNPKVIPYGTKLYIKSPDGKIIYGYAVAADTGGFIKKHPTGIDLFLTSESACQSFGVRQMEVYILK